VNYSKIKVAEDERLPPETIPLQAHINCFSSSDKDHSGKKENAAADIQVNVGKPGIIKINHKLSVFLVRKFLSVPPKLRTR